MATSQQLRANQQNNWNQFNSQYGKTTPTDWSDDYQALLGKGLSGGQLSSAVAQKYLDNMNAEQTLSPEVRKWIMSRAPAAGMMATFDQMTGQGTTDPSKVQGGLDFGAFQNWLNNSMGGVSRSGGINGYNPTQASAKMAQYVQGLRDAQDPNSTMNDMTRGIWNNMSSQDLLNYQRLLMQQTLAPDLYDAADSWLKNRWDVNQLSQHPQKMYDWLTQPNLFGTNWLGNTGWRYR